MIQFSCVHYVACEEDIFSPQSILKLIMRCYRDGQKLYHNAKLYHIFLLKYYIGTGGGAQYTVVLNVLRFF